MFNQKKSQDKASENRLKTQYGKSKDKESRPNRVSFGNRNARDSSGNDRSSPAKSSAELHKTLVPASSEFHETSDSVSEDQTPTANTPTVHVSYPEKGKVVVTLENLGEETIIHVKKERNSSFLAHLDVESSAPRDTEWHTVNVLWREKPCTSDEHAAMEPPSIPVPGRQEDIEKECLSPMVSPSEQGKAPAGHSLPLAVQIDAADEEVERQADVHHTTLQQQPQASIAGIAALIPNSGMYQYPWRTYGSIFYEVKNSAHRLAAPHARGRVVPTPPRMRTMLFDAFCAAGCGGTMSDACIDLEDGENGIERATEILEAVLARPEFWWAKFIGPCSFFVGESNRIV